MDTSSFPSAKRKLTISTRSLWGYNPEAMSLDNPQDRQTIIARVFDAGSHDDKLAVIAYFDRATIQEALVNSPELQGSTISLTAIWLGIDPGSYRAYRRMQTNDLPHATF